MRPVLAEAVELVTAPTQTILPLVRAVRHVKPLETLDLERLADLLRAVDRRIEQELGASVLRTTWREWFTPGDGRRLALREGPIVAVTEVRAFDDDDEAFTDGTVVAPSAYRARTQLGPAAVVLTDDASWPVTLREEAGVAITYTSGAATLLDVPADIQHAAALMAADWFEHPTSFVTGTSVAKLPRAADALLALHSQRRRCAA